MTSTASACRTALDSVLVERGRQEGLKAAGEFRATPADGTLSPTECLAVLAEEFGEVSREVAEAVAGKPLDSAHLRAELVQVAATAVAWIEGIDRERQEAIARERTAQAITEADLSDAGLALE